MPTERPQRAEKLSRFGYRLGAVRSAVAKIRCSPAGMLAGLSLLALGLGCTPRKQPAPSSEPDAAVESHLTVEARRAAARSLAHRGEPGAFADLLASLSDEDAEAVAFSAHGLGWLCDVEGADAKKITGALVTRSLSLPTRKEARFDPAFAIARALARCPVEETEALLVAWLGRQAPWNSAAALALGDLASRTEALSEKTQAALLEIVERGRGSADEALFALGRIHRVEPSLRGRLFDAASARLATKDQKRIFAVRALGRAGDLGAITLASVLKSPDYDAAEQAEAARGLARSGELGQELLAGAVSSKMPARDGLEALESEAFGPLLTTVEMLRGGSKAAREPLRALASLTIPEGAEASLARRITRLRCAAITHLLDAGVDKAKLVRCAAPPSPKKSEPVDEGKDGASPPLEHPVRLTFVTDAGSASILLDPELAPLSAARFVELARQGRFDGAAMGRVIPGSFVQIGPASSGSSRSPLPRETAPVAFEAFDVGVALEEDGGGSTKLFVTLARHPELDGHYTWLGRADPAFAKLAEGDVIERVTVSEARHPAPPLSMQPL